MSNVIRVYSDVVENCAELVMQGRVLFRIRFVSPVTENFRKLKFGLLVSNCFGSESAPVGISRSVSVDKYM
jgi:hypothetical protein